MHGAEKFLKIKPTTCYIVFICNRLENDYDREIKFDVTVEEEHTGRSQNTSMSVMMHKHEYKMELIKTSDFFKPGLKYTAFVSKQ